MRAELRWICFEHIDRLPLERQTRGELHGPLFKDWFYIVQHVQWSRWNDGDRWLTSYVAHPAEQLQAGSFVRTTASLPTFEKRVFTIQLTERSYCGYSCLVVRMPCDGKSAH
jgi:hypothetical protein